MTNANGNGSGHRPALSAVPALETPAEDDPGEAEPRIRLTPASTVRMRPVRWMWASRIPAGAITVIPGREGIGKSLTLAWLAAQLTTGRLPGIHHGTPRPVVYAATEDSWAHTIAPRLYAAGANLDLVYRVDVERGGRLDQLTLPRDCAQLAAEIDRLGVAMLAADPLLSLIASGLDTHRDRELRTALEPLARLADKSECAVVGLAHFNKSAGTDSLNLITGSRAFSAVARAVIAIARDPNADDSSCVMTQVKNNLGHVEMPSLRYVIHSADVPTPEGPAHVGVLQFTGETSRSVTDILAESHIHPAERSDRDEAARWLADFLTGRDSHEAPATLVYQQGAAAGLSRDQLKRAKTKAAVVSRKASFGTGWVWALTGPDREGSTKGANSAGPENVLPSLPSRSSARPAQTAHQQPVIPAQDGGPDE